MATTTYNTGSAASIFSMAFASDGTAYFGDSAGKVHRIATSGTITSNWATLPGECRGMACDSNDNVYSAVVNNTVSKITPAGSVTNNWCTGFSNVGRGIAIDSNDIMTITALSTSFYRVDTSGTIIGTYAKGTGAGIAAGITIDGNDTVYLAGLDGGTITKCTSDGTVTNPWVSRSGAWSVAADKSTGTVYATDLSYSPPNNGVHKILSNGTATWSWKEGSTVPLAVAVGPQGNIYVRYDNGNITKITSAGDVTTSWATTANGGDFRGYIATDPLGNVWTNNGNNATVYKVDTDQVPLSSPPDPPTSLTATPGDESLSIAFTAGDDNGAEISNYEYTLDDGSSWTALSPADATSPITVPGLTNGTEYAIKLRAVNSAGSGDPSAEVTGTPATVPAAPTDLVATPSNESATIAFTAGDDGGATITGYEYTIDDGVTWQAVATWE